MKMEGFKLIAPYPPAGDQPKAIRQIVQNLKEGVNFQTLLGITGSGKTFTMANVIAQVNKPTLIISPNKTLAAQLYSEFKQYFPYNAVEYFISYYDYYQPEAYIPQTDTYIEKDSKINEQLDRLRLSTTVSLITRRDVLVVASVSCIYNLGSPEDYKETMFFLEKGQKIEIDEVMYRLVGMQYERNDYDLKRGTFRVRGDVLEIFPAYKEEIVRIEFWGDEIDKIEILTPIERRVINELDKIGIYPAKHFIVGEDRIEKSLQSIEEELKAQVDLLQSQGKLLEAQRLIQRTRFDMEMLREIGYCHGIENYSRHLSGRPPGSRPYTLIDYFPEDFFLIIDESHIAIPQLRAMYEGDKSRKMTLVKYGFRLPSCLDNRPLKFEEFEAMMPQTLFVSATPGPYELEKSGKFVVEQIVRPTGLLDPEVEVRATEGQIEDIIREVNIRVEKGQRVLITTLTKRMAEDLTFYLQDRGFKVRYLHSEIDPLERVKILRSLRLRDFDVLVGINLLREGLDLPEVALVIILDADKEGFLRSTRSLMQIAGRAARNVEGKVILYADRITESIQELIDETERRRKIQMEYNRRHNITPKTIQKAVSNLLKKEEEEERERDFVQEDIIAELTRQMLEYARNLQFEQAARIRDKIREMKKNVS